MYIIQRPKARDVYGKANLVVHAFIHGAEASVFDLHIRLGGFEVSDGRQNPRGEREKPPKLSHSSEVTNHSIAESDTILIDSLNK